MKSLKKFHNKSRHNWHGLCDIYFLRKSQTLIQTIKTTKRAISRDAKPSARIRKITVMKKLMMIAVVAGALFVVGSASNAQAGGLYGGYVGGNTRVNVGFGNGYGNFNRGGYGGGYRGGYGYGNGFGNGYRGVYGHNHGYGFGGYDCYRPAFGGYGGGYRW